MERQLAPLGLNWSFLDAHRHAPPDLPVGQMIDRELTQGELGCFGSHYAAWQWFLGQSEADFLVVLEDDTVIDPDFFLDIDGWARELGPVDMVRLYGHQSRRWSRVARIRNKRLVRYLEAPTGTQAYILTRRGAARLVRAIKRIDRPIDDELNRFWVHGVLPLALFPYPVIECCGPSSAVMGDRRVGRMTAATALRYRAHRLGEDLRRIACNIRLGVTQRLKSG